MTLLALSKLVTVWHELSRLEELSLLFLPYLSRNVVVRPISSHREVFSLRYFDRNERRSEFEGVSFS